MNSDKKAFGNNTEKMNTLIRKLCKKSKVIGANIALFNNETILYDYNYGYANKEDNLKSTNESLYMIASAAYRFTKDTPITYPEFKSQKI